MTHRPRDRFLLYHEDELSSFGPDVFNVDLDKYPLGADAGPSRSMAHPTLENSTPGLEYRVQ
eukprot:15612-Eustigmatos_ZCMA.PRE.1